MPEPHDDRVQRRFVTDAPNRLWCTDVAEHPTATGKLYCCAVVDVFSRVIVGSSISDHRRAELVVDALQMDQLGATARGWRRGSQRPAAASTPRGRSGTGCPKPGCRPDGPPRLLPVDRLIGDR
jgi:putative transposase